MNESRQKIDEDLLEWFRGTAKTEEPLHLLDKSYPWGSVALGATAAQISGALTAKGLDVLLVVTQGSPEWHQVRWTSRPLPSAYALEVRRKVVEVMLHVKPPPHVNIETGPVRRVLWNYGDVERAGEEGRRLARDQTTCVVIELHCKGYGTRALIVNAEEK